MTTEQQFLKDVADHQMIVLCDDGLYRHIRFKQQGGWNMHFDLVTWPGYLAYSGDMGCYVFQRLEDMFQFFRTDRRDFNYNQNGLSINLGYWSEKLRAVDGNRHKAGATEFSEERFRRIVLEHLVSWIREHRDVTTKEERRDLWDAVMSDVIDTHGDKQSAACEFEHRVNRSFSFSFRDFWEHDLTEYTYHFKWCCYALAWGIAKYDAETVSKDAQPA